MAHPCEKLILIGKIGTRKKSLSLLNETEGFHKISAATLLSRRSQAGKEMALRSELYGVPGPVRTANLPLRRKQEHMGTVP